MLELLGKAPDPARARRLTRAQISAALKRAHRNIPDKASAIMAALPSEQLGQPTVLTAAYAAIAVCQVGDRDWFIPRRCARC